VIGWRTKFISLKIPEIIIREAAEMSKQEQKPGSGRQKKVLLNKYEKKHPS